jgi:uncharacterized protein (DUF2141 family)
VKKPLRSSLLLCALTPTLLLGLGAAESNSSPNSNSPEPSSQAQSNPNSDTNADLTIDITDLRDAKGSIRISVYSAPDGFMKDDSKANAKGVVSASADRKYITFHLPPGKYAVALFHDENDNGKLDTNFLGIPTEGYGVSNNPKPKFRAPRYKEALFDLPKEGKSANISLQYVG